MSDVALQEEVDKRLRNYPCRPGDCVYCRDRPVAGGDSTTSQCARKLDLCGRCYGDKATRARRRRDLGLPPWKRRRA